MALFKVAVVADKFKGSLTANQVTSIVADVLTKLDQVEVVQVPMADGGDGTLDVIEHLAYDSLFLNSVDPLGRPIEVKTLQMEGRAMCEMAQSTGVSRLQINERNPLITSSYGFGLVIDKLAREGCKNFLLGVGGSATNDVGIGMLSALGFCFLDSEGREISSKESRRQGCSSFPNLLSGEDLIKIAHIDDSRVPHHIRELNIEVACDVNNPLYGPNGATHIYGAQKGATDQMIEELELGVRHFAQLSKEWSGVDFSGVCGAGAAGGVGYALALFLKAKLSCGWRLLFDMVNVEQRIKEANLVITGEGRVDRQSLSGKLLDGVLEIASLYNKPVWVVCGNNLLSEQELRSAGVEKLFSISQIELNKERAIANAKNFLSIKSGEVASSLDELIKLL